MEGKEVKEREGGLTSAVRISLALFNEGFFFSSSVQSSSREGSKRGRLGVAAGGVPVAPPAGSVVGTGGERKSWATAKASPRIPCPPVSLEWAWRERTSRDTVWGVIRSVAGGFIPEEKEGERRSLKRDLSSFER